MRPSMGAHVGYSVRCVKCGKASIESCRWASPGRIFLCIGHATAPASPSATSFTPRKLGNAPTGCLALTEFVVLPFLLPRFRILQVI